MRGSIEIKGFIETSFVDWPGKICSVLFFPQCTFRCPYCHNPDLVLNGEGMESIAEDQVLDRLDRLAGWIDGVCLSGGEPTLQKGLEGFMERLHQMGLLIKVDTNGSHPSRLQAWIESGLVHAVSMDVKAPLEQAKYDRCAGQRVDLDAIRRSIDLLKRAPVQVEFRTTVVPSLLTKEEVFAIAVALRGGTRYTLQNFHPRKTLDPRLGEETPWPPEEFEKLQRQVALLFRSEG